MNIREFKIPHRFRSVCGFFWTTAVAFCALLLMGAMANAQVNTADIIGTVMDPTGAVVPGASVTIENLGTGATRNALSSDAGTYAFTFLPVGEYRVTVELPGFKTFVAPSVSVSGGDRARVDAKLEIGSVSEQITVTGQAPALQTDSRVVGQTVTSVAVQELPLNGRNFIELAQIAPGATEGGPNAMNSGARPDDRRATSAISVNGMSETANNYMIDGMDNNERSIGTQGVRPSIDAMAEFNVQTNLYSADVTRTAGGVINIITKSGTNEFHGTAFEFYRNENFDANSNYSFGTSTVQPRAKYRQHQYGASIGGPIIRDKTFFFGDYEGLDITQGVAFSGQIVPTAKQRAGDFSEPGNVTIYDPVTGEPFQDNIIPPERINPVVRNVLELFPDPTGPGVRTSNFESNVPKTQDSSTFDVRVDHRINNDNQFFTRYSFNDVTTVTPSAFPEVNGILPGGCNCAPWGFSWTPAGNFAGLAEQRAQNLQFNYVRVFSTNTLLEARAGYMRTVLGSLADNTKNSEAASSLGIENVYLGDDEYPMTAGLPQMVLAPYVSIGDFQYIPMFFKNNVFQFNGNLNLNRGPHSIKVGAAYIKRHIGTQQTSRPRGQWSYSDVAPSGYDYGTGDTFASFLLDLPRSYDRVNQLVWFNNRQSEVGLFIQDDWRANNWLTLNLGVRWDVITPVSEKNNYMTNWDIAAKKMVHAGEDGATNYANVKPDWNNFSPRIGFAAMLGRGLVLRGGYGITYFTGEYGAGGHYGKNAPFFHSYQGGCGAAFGYTIECPGIADGATVPPTELDWTLIENEKLAGGVSGNSQNKVLSMVHQWNVTIQKDFAGNVVGIGYVGNLARKQNHGRNLNAYQTPSFGEPLGARPLADILPNNPSINLGFSEGKSNYNAMQVTFDRRLAAGLSINAHHTWSHALSNVGGGTSLQGGTGGGGWIANWEKFDYGTSGQDARHRTAIMLNYTLPFGNNLTGAARTFLAGWQINTMYKRRTGMPFTVVNSSNRLGNYGSADRPNQIGPYIYPKELTLWFDPSSFELNDIGFPGTGSVMDGVGPPNRSWNLSVNKLFQITEGKDIQVRIEGFNILNQPNFLNPNASLPGNFDPTDKNTWGGVGQVTALNGTPRQIQFAVKFLF